MLADKEIFFFTLKILFKIYDFLICYKFNFNSIGVYIYIYLYTFSIQYISDILSFP